MRLLNSGTLNRGINLCVTVAIDHLTVDGFHDELQLSAKNTEGKALRLTYRNSTNSVPETLSKYVWYAGGEVWKGTLLVADLEQVDKNRRVGIPQHKAQREGDDLAQIGDNTENRRWTIRIYWRSGSENSNLDKVPSKFEEKFKKTFLENQTGFHQPTKQEIIAHEHSHQQYLLKNCFEKYLGKLVMNFFNKQTYAV